MGGLALGGWLALKIIDDRKKAFKWLKKVQLLISFLSLIIIVSLFILSGIKTIFLITETFLLLLIIITGFLGGFHFQLTNSLYMQDRTKKTFGIIYSADLLGASIGALLISSIIIPITGIIISCIYLFILNLIALLLLIYTKNI